MPAMNKKTASFNFAYVIIAALGVMALQDWWIRNNAVATIPYSEFQRLVREDKVSEVLVSQDQIQGDLKEPLNGKKRFVTVRVDPDISKELAQHGVTFAGRFESEVGPLILSWIIPIGLFIGVWYFLGRRMAKQLGGGGAGGLMSIGKSKAKVYVETDTKVTFADVAGVDEAKDELKEVVAFLKEPEVLRPARRAHAEGRAAGRPARHRQDAARQGGGRRGGRAVLLHLRLRVRGDVRGRGRRARARPVRAGPRQGAGHHLHRRAGRARPRPRQHAGMGGGHDEKEQTLNQLLVELDGFDPTAGIVLLAATNRPEILDPALLRAGRFDRQVLVDRPDRDGRRRHPEGAREEGGARPGREARGRWRRSRPASPAPTSPTW